MDESYGPSPLRKASPSFLAAKRLERYHQRCREASRRLVVRTIAECKRPTPGEAEKRAK